MIEIVDHPIDVNALVATDGSGASGGLVLFLGTVRNRTEGKGVVRLEYEAYGEMARSELETIVAEAKRRFEIDSVDVVHRVGTLGMGEVAVAIAVRAPHRGAAFDACRYTIDTLKETVPIWKKEFFEDGAVWVGDRP
ncbi:MAG: molybdenum cofactor biosynthesis protein MoaE [Planctomycetota bacterium JB042]